MASKPSRYVDKIRTPSTRPKEMQVLCLGLSRTSTMSLYSALNQLGYRSYHMLETGNNKKDKHYDCWLEGLTIKYYGKGTPYGREEFDKLLGNYSAVTDAPCVNFSDELLAAYPDAKVVLTTRDVDKWLPSMERSYYKILAWKWWMALAAVDNEARSYTDLLRLVLTDWTAGNWQDREALREGYLKHYAHIREVVPKERMLEFRPEMGWEPLCKFLGKQVPRTPYPRINEGNYAANLHIVIFWLKIWEYIKWPTAVGVVAWGTWYYWVEALV